MKKGYKYLLCILVIIISGLIIYFNRFNAEKLNRTDMIVISLSILVIILMIMIIIYLFVSPEKRKDPDIDFFASLIERRNDEIINRLSYSEGEKTQSINTVVEESKENIQHSENIETDSEFNDEVKESTNDLEEYIDDKPMLDEKRFVSKAYDKFCEVQKAWMDHNYDYLRKELTEDLYNKYSAYLDLMSLKGQEQHMTDFSLVSSKLIEVENTKEESIVRIELVISSLIYIENIKNGKIIKGSKDNKVKTTYELEYIKKLNDKNWLLSSKKIINRE